METINEVLKRQEQNWLDAKVEKSEKTELTTGTYKMQIENVEIGQSKSKGLWQMTWTLKVLDTMFEGKKHWARTPLEGDFISISKKAVHACGFDIEEGFSEVLLSLVKGEAFNGLVIEVYISDKGNTFFNGIVGETKEKVADSKNPWDN
jgi:hypothetical protein